MSKEEALRAELAELEAANKAATGWGAAVGARQERINSIRRQLSRPSGADAGATAKAVLDARATGLGVMRMYGDGTLEHVREQDFRAPPLPEPVAVAPDLVELIERLRKQAQGASEAQRMMAEAKSLRQSDNPEGRSDLYSWAKPEETLEARAADALAALSAKLDAMRRERDNLSNELDAMEEEQCGCDDVIRKAEEAREAAEAEVARLKDENKELVAGLEAVDAEIVLTGQLKDIVDKALARALLPAKKEG